VTCAEVSGLCELDVYPCKHCCCWCIW